MSPFDLLMIFAVALSATAVVRKAASAAGFTDKSDGDPLKIHRKPVPLTGGAAVFIAVLFGMALEIRYFVNSGMAVAGFLIFAVGLWDDFRKIKPLIRLTVHISAAAVVVLSDAGAAAASLPLIEILIKIFYIVAVINAFNLIDGMDGLCAGMALVSCIGFFFLGLRQANAFSLFLSAILVMSLLGFLPFNFHPARIFLGDAGSGLLGYLTAVMGAASVGGSHDFQGLAVAVLVIGMPVLDTASAILRRFLGRKSIFAGDRDHLYDLLLKRGWSQPRAWSLMCACQSISVGAAVFIGGICCP